MRATPVLMLAFACQLLSVILSPRALAQETTGALEGRTLGLDGTPLSGTTVVVTSAVLQGSRGTTVDAKGNFRISNLPPGTYSVRIAHVARRPVTLKDVRILIGRTMSLGEITLREQSVEVEEVVIAGARPLIDPRSTATGV